MPLDLKPRSGSWHIIGTVTSKFGEKVRVRKSTGFNMSQRRMAEDELQRILLLALEGLYKGETKKKDTTTVEFAVDAFLNRPTKPGKTDVSNGNILVRALGSKTFASLTLEEAMSWAHHGGLASNSVARRLQTLSAVITHAKNNGLEYPRLEIVKPVYDDARVRWLDEDQRDALIDSAPEEIRAMIIVLFYTGVRIGELFRMRWDHVVRGNVHVTSYKGKKKKKLVRSIPLPREALDAMGKRGSGLIFPTRSGIEWDRSDFYPFFNEACDICGITDFHPHDCRHTYASLLVQKGASLRAVADLLGHTTLSMVMRYAHLAPSHLKTTVDLLTKRDTFETHGISFARHTLVKNNKETIGYDTH